MNLDLTCGEHTVHAFVRKEGTYESRHSGKQLKSLEFTVDALNEDQIEWSQKFANDSKAVKSTIEGETKQWQIGHSEYMTTNNLPVPGLHGNYLKSNICK